MKAWLPQGNLSIVVVLLSGIFFAGPAIGLDSETPERNFQIATTVRQVIRQGREIERREGWLEYAQGRYTLEVSKGVEPVRLLRITAPGDFDTVRARLESIRERLEYALDRLNFHEKGLIKLKESSGGGVSIYVTAQPTYTRSHNGLYPVRIMTVNITDARQFPALDRWNAETQTHHRVPRTPERVASFLAAQIEAHLVLFVKVTQDYDEYKNIALENTHRGKIYRETYLRGRDVADVENTEVNAEIVDDALDRISLQQRERVQNLHFVVPRLWESAHRGIYFK